MLPLSLHRVRALLREAQKMIVVAITVVLAVLRGGVMALAISKAVAETLMLLMLYQRYRICRTGFHYLTIRSMSCTHVLIAAVVAIADLQDALTL
jgi:hypothetical protein